MIAEEQVPPKAFEDEMAERSIRISAVPADRVFDTTNIYKIKLTGSERPQSVAGQLWFGGQ